MTSPLTSSTQAAPTIIAPTTAKEADKKEPPKRRPGDSESSKPHPAPAATQPSPEETVAIERRYLELAQPSEFDGIRSQIARELDLPKSVVKRVIKEYRERLHLPSWWDVSHQSLNPAQREIVRQHYAPLLPLPPIGVHQQLAQELGLNSWAVYHAIGSIRQELGLEQFNEREDAPRPALAFVDDSRLPDETAPGAVV